MSIIAHPLINYFRLIFLLNKLEIENRISLTLKQYQNSVPTNEKNYLISSPFGELAKIQIFQIMLLDLFDLQ
jgi:hypothetical protein